MEQYEPGALEFNVSTCSRALGESSKECTTDPVSSHKTDPVKSLDFSYSCPDISWDNITGTLSSHVCQYAVPMQVMVPGSNYPVISPSHC